MVVCGGLRCGDVVLCLPLRRKGRGGNGYAMDDFFLARVFGGGSDPSLPSDTSPLKKEYTTKFPAVSDTATGVGWLRVFSDV